MKVLIACPTKRRLPSYFVYPLLELFQSKKEHSFSFWVEEREHAINYSRDHIANKAVDEGFDTVIMIDDDHPWQPEHVFSILKHEEAIVCGLYCTKSGGDAKWVGLRHEFGSSKDGLLEMAYVGTGFLRIDVSVLKDMRAQLSSRRYHWKEANGDYRNGYSLFPLMLVGPNTAGAKLAEIRRLCDESASDKPMDFIKDIIDAVHPEPAHRLGEDYGFSYLARKCGHRLWLDPSICLYHMGEAPFPIEQSLLPKEQADLAYAALDPIKY